MKRQISLKWYVTLTFLSLMTVLVIGYSLLSAHFYILGMDNVTSGTMHEVLQTYVQTVPPAQRRQLTQFSGYQIAPTWEQLPEKIRSSVAKPASNNVMLKSRPRKGLEGPGDLFFVMASTINDQHFYISRTLHHENLNPLVGQQARQSMHFLLTLGLAIAAVIFLLLWLFLKQVSRPVARLGNWARNLNESNLAVSPPDFGYPELNELATLTRASLSSVQESLEREQRFLRHSSHELRTPIAIIRNNIELLYKVQKRLATTPDQRQAQIVERIDRASLTMKNLTETLLWLSRESQEEIPAQHIDLDVLLRELIDEQRYLLKDKPVETRIETTPAVINIPQIPARIVLGNLVRNAFQHSSQGLVSIRQQQGTITITNPVTTGSATNPDLGFGLGLQLTEQLTEKMNWPYRNRVEGELNIVEIELDS